MRFQIWNYIRIGLDQYNTCKSQMGLTVPGVRKSGRCSQSNMRSKPLLKDKLRDKNQGVFVKHYGMPPVATKSKKVF